jgi:spore germination protein KC
MLFSTSACRFKDIDRRAFIVAIGLDLGESKDELQISVKVAKPKTQQVGLSSSSEEENFVFYEASDSSIGNGLRKIKGQLSLEPDYSHLKAIVIGKSLTDNFTLNEIIDYFIRRTDIQKIAWLMVGEPSAKAVISLMPKGENVAANFLFLKFGQGVQPQFVNITKTHEVFSEINVPGLSISCPVIEVIDKKFVAENTAIFHDGRIQMILDKSQTRILNILELGLTVGFITTYGEEKNPIGIRMQKAKAKISLEESDTDSLTCNITVDVSALLEESSNTYKDVDYFEKIFEEIFTNHTIRLMNDLKDNGLDPLGLQLKYWAKHPEYKFNENWISTIYPKIKFNVTSNVIIQQTETLK